jgi:colanic acid biosynthesis protein WcaH
MYVSDSDFKVVLNSTPLVSMDFLIKNRDGCILLGLRRNRPAQGYWFVPGGRIRKNESLAQAFRRLSQYELGQPFEIGQARLQGPFDHFYNDSIFGEIISTHYVAMSYYLDVDTLDNLPYDQHRKYHWFTIAELLEDPLVHPNSKAYFITEG